MEHNQQDVILDEEVLPVPPDKRTLSIPGNFAIWFACNMVTTTMLTGMLFIPGITFIGAMQAITLGCLVGIIPLVLIGVIGQKTGLVTMVVSRATFGVKGAIIPSMINLMILVAWSWAQAALGGLALDHGISTLTGYTNPTLWIIFTEAFVVLVALYAIKGIALYEKVAMVLIALILGAVIYEAIAVVGMDKILGIASVPDKAVTKLIAFDIVVATALSWTVMGADYNRNCKSLAATVIGTGGGYTLGTILSMGSGALMLNMLLSSNMPANYEPSEVFDQIGFGLAGSVVIFMSIVAANVMCVYSSTMSFLNTFPKFAYKSTALVIGAICIIGAVYSGILERFLAFVGLIGSLFLPIFAIMIADFFVVQKRKYNIDAIIYPHRDRRYQYAHGFNLRAVVVFVVAASFAFYFILVNPIIPIGATIPTFFVAFFGYILAMKLGRARAF